MTVGRCLILRRFHLSVETHCYRQHVCASLPSSRPTELLVEKGDYFLMSHDNDTVKFECNHVLVIYVVLAEIESVVIVVSLYLHCLLYSYVLI